MLNAERAFRYLPTIGYTYVRPRQVAQIRVYWNQSRRMITGGGSRVGRYLSRGVPADELEARRQQRMQTASCANTRAKPILGFQERVVPPPLLFQPNHSLLLDPSTIVVLEALRNGDCLIERIASTSASRSEMNPASRMRRGNRPLRW